MMAEGVRDLVICALIVATLYAALNIVHAVGG